MTKFISLLLTVCFTVLLLSGCGAPTEGGSEKGGGDTISGTDSENTLESLVGSSGTPAETDFAKSDSDMFTDRDYEVGYNENESILVELDGSTARASSDSVLISGSTVKITEDATHIISGSLDDGMIIVNAPDTAKLQLVLNGVNINSKTSAPIYILSADKVFVTLAPDTENTLSNGGTFTAIDENNIDAVIFSKQDITLNGSGALTVTSPAGHGIVSKDDLVLTSGIYTVNSASHGLDANDSVRIAGASVTVDSGKDGINAENSEDTSLGFVYVSGSTLNIDAEGDGISAGAYMQISSGNINITAGGGSENGTKESSDSWGGFMGGGRPGQSMSYTSESFDSENSSSMKGLKSDGGMLITDGSITIDSADDAVHSNASVTVNGGNFEIASGDDAFHAEETLTVTAGGINITESYEGLEALHIAVSGGDIKLVASDDGLNAAGGVDSSGAGGRDTMFGGDRGGMGGIGDMTAHGGMTDPGGMGGGMSSSSNGSIVISGGNLYINSSGDGIDANGTLEISGGYTVIVGPTQGDTATLDYDVSASITGGTFIGTGASNMAQSFSSSEQGVVAASVGNQSAGTAVTLADSDGDVIISYSPELSFQVIILSSPDIVSGQTYTVTVGSVSGELTAS